MREETGYGTAEKTGDEREEGQESEQKFTDYTFYMVLTSEPLFTSLIFHKKQTNKKNK